MKNPIILLSAVLAVALVGCIIGVMFMEPPEQKLSVNNGPNRMMPPTSNAPQVAAGEQLRASHILIMHNRSQRAPANIKRSQEEALELAQEVYAKARLTDADFANLARLYSDCTSAAKGGDLGVFPPSQMTPAFSAATLALKIDEMSEPVETPFGYHIILRKDPK